MNADKTKNSTNPGFATLTMRKLGRTMGAAKINMLEKMGKRDTTESPEMQLQHKKVEDIRVYLKEAYKKLYKSNKSSGTHLDDELQVSEAFRQYGCALANNGDSPTLARAFVLLADFQEFHHSLETRLDFLLELKVVEGMKDFVKGDVRDARYEKKKFDRIRQNYESAVENLKNSQKTSKANVRALQQEQDEVNRLKSQCEKASYDTLCKLEDVNHMNEYESLDKCCDYLEAYFDFFSKGFEWMQDVMPRVQKYREFISSSKRDFEKVQADRLENLDEHGRLKPRVFGVPLEELLKKENSQSHVPSVVTKCVTFLSTKQVLTEEGIFRISGAKLKVDELKKQFEEGKAVDLNATQDIHVVCSLLKMYLRELPEPLLSVSLSEPLAEDAPTEVRVTKLKEVVSKLPVSNRETLKVLFGLCSNIIKHVTTNKMNAANLATVLGPNLVPLSKTKGDLYSGNGLVEAFIEDYEMVFLGAPIRQDPVKPERASFSFIKRKPTANALLPDLMAVNVYRNPSDIDAELFQVLSPVDNNAFGGSEDPMPLPPLPSSTTTTTTTTTSSISIPSSTGGGSGGSSPGPSRITPMGGTGSTSGLSTSSSSGSFFIPAPTPSTPTTATTTISSTPPSSTPPAPLLHTSSSSSTNPTTTTTTSTIVQGTSSPLMSSPSANNNPMTGTLGATGGPPKVSGWAKAVVPSSAPKFVSPEGQ